MAALVFLGLTAIPDFLGAQDLAPAANSLNSLARPRTGKMIHPGSWDQSGRNHDFHVVRPGETDTMVDVQGTGVIRRMWCAIGAPNRTAVLRQAILRMYWDDEPSPSVEVPVGDFFGAGFGQMIDYVSTPLSITSGGYNCSWVMPFHKSARITLTNDSDAAINSFYYNFEVEMEKSLPPDTLYFHAQWRRENPATPDKNYTILEAQGRGSLAGVSLSMQSLQGGGFGFLEGDEMFWVDGEDQPSIHGTGTEDYFKSCWYFQTGTFSAPDHGCLIRDEPMGRVFAYRWHIDDPLPFRKSIRATIEHGSESKYNVDYSSVAYWYQTEPHASFPPLLSAEDRLPYTPPPPRKIDGAIEAEGLKPIARATSGTVKARYTGKWGDEWSGGADLHWIGMRPNARLRLELPAPAKGHYTIYGYFMRAANHGDVQAYVNGRKIGEPVSGYAPKVEHCGPIHLGEVELQDGANELVLELVGKDPRSTEYNVGVDCFVLQPH
ncbi:MAG: DUF2961 domain-containing protein [Candidatus Sumerlaeota bacterium]|nr:DUF2961 domain-containing protein [Candidatus Sumerlaeota bacterium]